jgi:hypothetical protein
MGGGRKKMLENEKYWNNPYVYKYNIMHHTVSCWILGEHGDREWVSNTGEMVNLIKAWSIQNWSTKTKLPWAINALNLKNEGQERK